MNTFLFSITNLLSTFTGHRGLYNFTDDNSKISAKFINIEKGFYVVHVKIENVKVQKFVQVADNDRNWSILYLSDRQLCFNNCSYPAGLVISFGEQSCTITIEPNQETTLTLILLHESFIKQYKYSDCFRKIKKSKKEIYHIPYTRLNHLPMFTPEKTMGLVKTKLFANFLLIAIRVEVEKIKTHLKKNINSYCSECLASNQNILMFMSKKVLIEPEYLMLLFNEVFQENIVSYYDEYKIRNAKNFIQTQRDDLDCIIIECLKGPCPVVILLAIRFELSVEKYRRLFLEETGVSLSKYCENVKLKAARQLLLDGLKTRNVAKAIGFSNPINLSRFLQRHEGLSPQQFRMKTTKHS